MYIKAYLWRNTCAEVSLNNVLTIYTAKTEDFVYVPLSERHREFKTMFELILEGERHVDQSRELYNHRENSEMKYRKDLEKGTERGGEEMKVMQERVTQAVKSKELAYLEGV